MSWLPWKIVWRRDRTWDFEGRCTKCHKLLNLYLRVETQNQVTLTLELCPTHPDDSFILWPADRDDIIRT